MYDKKKYLNFSELKLILRLLDFVFIIIGLCVFVGQFDIEYFNFRSENVIIWILVFVGYFNLFGNIFKIYNFKTSSNYYPTFKSLFLTITFVILFYVFTPYITPELPKNRIEIIYLSVSVLFPLVVWRFIYIKIISRYRHLKNILIIGNSQKIKEILDIAEKKSFQNSIINYASEAKIPKKNKFKYINIKTTSLIEIVKKEKVDDIFLSPNTLDNDLSSNLSKQIVDLFENGINIKCLEDLYEEITFCIAKESLNSDFYKNIYFSKNHENSFYLIFVFTLNIIISVFGLLIMTILIPFIIVGNFFGNKGPLFYTQERVGKKGVHFKIIKFRSMTIDAEKEGVAWTSKNDTRITYFGKFLRKTRIDEIPQFWNTLIGEMSLIGPRPERPEIVNNLKKEIPFYSIRNVIKPGLTGWAQVMFQYANTIVEQETKLRYDLFYIKSRSLFLDFKIIIKTINSISLLKGQ